MKDKISPTEMEDAIPPEAEGKGGKRGTESSSSIDNPIKSHDKNLKLLMREYKMEITERVIDETDQIIYLISPGEICRETGVSFKRGLELHEMILTRIHDLLLWGIEGDGVGIDGVVSDEGIMFKNAPISHMDN